jgi:hypothetical protein
VRDEQHAKQEAGTLPRFFDPALPGEQAAGPFRMRLSRHFGSNGGLTPSAHGFSLDESA